MSAELPQYVNMIISIMKRTLAVLLLLMKFVQQAEQKYVTNESRVKIQIIIAILYG